MAQRPADINKRILDFFGRVARHYPNGHQKLFRGGRRARVVISEWLPDRQHQARFPSSIG